jgi:hypothetical protein
VRLAIQTHRAVQAAGASTRPHGRTAPQPRGHRRNAHA